ncbi:MAG: hypothetical protein M0P04_03175 [Syntrophales bacterium]|jgi:polyhydroxyalkanoate synthesis regulator phasin|nr:hypothetical protein [Syntrophales bacterium]MDD4338513.1 hypothetical protein [Syntrophales bacterium]HOG06543.1 hypothetical protein [Syntrophales bacterium]HOS77776.1 hypothetical protein [Syntrophales bacterium]HPB69736.1 hypothetical protein [Syntrophales bacterium]
MEPKQMAKQMIQFNKAAFDNTFNAMTVLQDQAEKMMNSLIDQSAWMPAEGKKALSDWVKAYKRGREDFKAAMDDNYKKVDAFFAGLEKGKSA